MALKANVYFIDVIIFLEGGRNCPSYASIWPSNLKVVALFIYSVFCDSDCVKRISTLWKQSRLCLRLNNKIHQLPYHCLKSNVHAKYWFIFINQLSQVFKRCTARGHWPWLQVFWGFLSFQIYSQTFRSLKIKIISCPRKGKHTWVPISWLSSMLDSMQD